ncbi:hypothetical protein [uncultured Alteromonas sp.]|jgi:hypothetical protein|uniref:hypothetical protein n=1 Tax=uncultured Alteromonas sp. TaxID=179113 RepID=UPI00258BFA59|nr:hypothetical protein [uncultured Alteromonas sp.]
MEMKIKAITILILFCFFQRTAFAEKQCWRVYLTPPVIAHYKIQNELVHKDITGSFVIVCSSKPIYSDTHFRTGGGAPGYNKNRKPQFFAIDKYLLELQPLNSEQANAEDYQPWITLEGNSKLDAAFITQTKKTAVQHLRLKTSNIKTVLSSDPLVTAEQFLNEALDRSNERQLPKSIENKLADYREISKELNLQLSVDHMVENDVKFISISNIK